MFQNSMGQKRETERLNIFEGNVKNIRTNLRQFDNDSDSDEEYDFRNNVRSFKSKKDRNFVNYCLKPYRNGDKLKKNLKMAFKNLPLSCILISPSPIDLLVSKLYKEFLSYNMRLREKQGELTLLSVTGEPQGENENIVVDDGVTALANFSTLNDDSGQHSESSITVLGVSSTDFENSEIDLNGQSTSEPSVFNNPMEENSSSNQPALKDATVEWNGTDVPSNLDYNNVLGAQNQQLNDTTMNYSNNNTGYYSNSENWSSNEYNNYQSYGPQNYYGNNLGNWTSNGYSDYNQSSNGPQNYYDYSGNWSSNEYNNYNNNNNNYNNNNNNNYSYHYHRSYNPQNYNYYLGNASNNYNNYYQQSFGLTNYNVQANSLNSVYLNGGNASFWYSMSTIPQLVNNGIPLVSQVSITFKCLN